MAHGHTHTKCVVGHACLQPVIELTDMTHAQHCKLRCVGAWLSSCRWHELQVRVVAAQQLQHLAHASANTLSLIVKRRATFKVVPGATAAGSDDRDGNGSGGDTAAALSEGDPLLYDRASGVGYRALLKHVVYIRPCASCPAQWRCVCCALRGP